MRWDPEIEAARAALQAHLAGQPDRRVACAHIGCDQRFHRSHGNQRYCSERCQGNAGHLRRTGGARRRCKRCRKTFVRNRDHKKYCSDQCAREAWKRSIDSIEAK